VGQPVEVVVSDLHSASARLADSAQQLQDGLSSVNDETTQLLGSGWKGGAASAYAPVWQQWNDGAKKVVEGLQRMSEMLDIAAKEYAKTDQSAAEGLGSTMQGSGGSSGSGGGGTASGDSGGAPASASTGGSSGGSGASSGSGSGVSEGLGQAMSAVGQLGGAAMQPLAQAGQAIAGLAQQAAQLATELAQDAEKADSDEKDAEKADGATASGDHATGTAPVEDGSTPHAEASRAVERPREEER
jgi:WXG100 family type VII secretion target